MNLCGHTFFHYLFQINFFFFNLRMTSNKNKIKNKKKSELTKTSNGTANGTNKIGANKWKNKQRVLLINSRGVSYLARHVITNLKNLMPHAKVDSKFNRKHGLIELSEIAEIRNCNKVLFIEMHRKQDAYMWLSAAPDGPSAKFSLENMHTMEELKLTGNCLKGSRPILSFNGEFDSMPYLKLLKELFVQIFGTPNHHPKSQPFVDHVMNFSLVDNKIWVRNFQIGDENGNLAEIGPRYPIIILININFLKVESNLNFNIFFF
jgi:ribosome biogenesis protein BRX1